MTTLLTPADTAKRLGISRTTLYELLRAGQLKSVKIGSSRRIPLETIEDYVTELLNQAEGAAQNQQAHLTTKSVISSDPSGGVRGGGGADDGPS